MSLSHFITYIFDFKSDWFVFQCGVFSVRQDEKIQNLCLFLNFPSESYCLNFIELETKKQMGPIET